MTSFDIKIEINQLIQNWCMANSNLLNFDLITNKIIKIIDVFLMLESKCLNSQEDVLFKLQNKPVINFKEIIIQYIFCLGSYIDDFIRNEESDLEFDYKRRISYVYQQLSEIIFKYKTQSQ
jgi:hypothetical protein